MNCWLLDEGQGWKARTGLTLVAVVELLIRVAGTPGFEAGGAVVAGTLGFDVTGVMGLVVDTLPPVEAMLAVLVLTTEDADGGTISWSHLYAESCRRSGRASVTLNFR